MALSCCLVHRAVWTNGFVEGAPVNLRAPCRSHVTDIAGLCRAEVQEARGHADCIDEYCFDDITDANELPSASEVSYSGSLIRQKVSQLRMQMANKTLVGCMPRPELVLSA